MKDVTTQRESEKSSPQLVDWWYQWKTTGLAQSGFWAQVLLRPARDKKPKLSQ